MIASSTQPKGPIMIVRTCLTVAACAALVVTAKVSYPETATGTGTDFPNHTTGWSQCDPINAPELCNGEPDNKAMRIPAPPEWTHMLPKTMRKPCPQEDSVNCYWDAQTAGNHIGHSYIVRQFPRQMMPNGKLQTEGTICVMYVLRADARKWDYCD